MYTRDIGEDILPKERRFRFIRSIVFVVSTMANGTVWQATPAVQFVEDQSEQNDDKGVKDRSRHLPSLSTCLAPLLVSMKLCGLYFDERSTPSSPFPSSDISPKSSQTPFHPLSSFPLWDFRSNQE